MTSGLTNYVAIVAALMIVGALLAVFVSPWWWIIPLLLSAFLLWAAWSFRSKNESPKNEEEDDDDDLRITVPMTFEGSTLTFYFYASGKLAHILDVSGKSEIGGIAFVLARLWETDPIVLINRIRQRRDIAAGSASLAFEKPSNDPHARFTVTGSIGPMKGLMEDGRFIDLASSCFSTFAALSSEHGWGNADALRNAVGMFLLEETTWLDVKQIDAILYDPEGPTRTLETLGMAPLSIRARVLAEVDAEALKILLRVIPGESAWWFLMPLAPKIRELIAEDIICLPFPAPEQWKAALAKIDEWMANAGALSAETPPSPDEALDTFQGSLRLLSGLKPSWRNYMLPGFFLEQIRLLLIIADWRQAYECVHSWFALHNSVLPRTRAIAFLIIALDRKAANEMQTFEELFLEALVWARQSWPLDESDSLMPAHEDMVETLLEAEETALALRVADDVSDPSLRDDLCLNAAGCAMRLDQPATVKGATSRIQGPYANLVLAAIEAENFARRGKLEAALDAVDRAASRLPRIASLAVVAAAHLKAAKHDKAHEFIDELLRIARNSEPEDRADIFEHLGELYVIDGNDLEAHALWKNERDGERRNRTQRGIVAALAGAHRFAEAFTVTEEMNMPFFKADALRLIASRAIESGDADTATTASETMLNVSPDTLTTADTVYRAAILPNVDAERRLILLKKARDAALRATRVENALSILAPIAQAIAKEGPEAICNEFAQLAQPIPDEDPYGRHHVEELARRCYLTWLTIGPMLDLQEKRN